MHSTLIAQWGEELAARGCSGRTVTEWTRIASRCADMTGRPPDALRREDLVVFLARPGLSAASKATYYTALTAWHQWLQHTDRRADDPTAALPRPRHPTGSPRPLTTVQVQRVFAQPMRAQTRVKLLLACYQGLRVHEIARVRGEDVDPWARTLRVRGKGGRTDVLDLHPEVCRTAVGMPPRGWWFPSPRGGHVAGTSVSDVLGRVIDRAGVTGSAHQLRHWYATELVRAGVPLTTVQRLMRHSSLATTQRYVAVADDSAARALLTLPDVTPLLLTKDAA